MPLGSFKNPAILPHDLSVDFSRISRRFRKAAWRPALHRRRIPAGDPPTDN